MRKCLTGSLILLLLLFRIAGTAFAAEAAGVDIPVVIDGGGTAYIIPEVNSPLPTENALRVDNGRTGRFHIDFNEVGEYRYTVSAVFSRSDGEVPADGSFRLTVTVLNREDGVLYAVAVISGSQTGDKTDLVRFRETAETTPEPPPETPEEPFSPTQPKTGDESHLTRYMLISLASAAGLFALALLYTVNTNKLIKKERR